MFNKLTDFKYQRTGVQALGFYFAYLVLIILVSVILASILGLITGNETNFGFGARIGLITSVISVLLICYLVIKNKKLTKEFLYIILLLCSAILAYFGGGVLGLIIPSYLTTKKFSR